MTGHVSIFREFVSMLVLAEVRYFNTIITSNKMMTKIAMVIQFQLSFAFLEKVVSLLCARSSVFECRSTPLSTSSSMTFCSSISLPI